ncbi:MAG: isopeptide-forming domain-containing fimbrial protein [Acutalibacteraceae bacterium]|nr:isopeptide-forming domain-containing fimbrial protein [Acutalibacteraceae bacterium]
MKLFNKTASVLLAISMTAMLTTTALATNTDAQNLTEPTDDSASSTYVDISTHEFTVYQVFSATQDDEDDALLCDIEWGNGVDVPLLLSKLGSIEAFDALKGEDGVIPADLPATEVAAVLEKILEVDGDDSAAVRAFAALAHQCISGTGTKIGSSTTIDGAVVDGSALDPGYYLVVDITSTNGQNTAKNLSLLQATRDTSMNITSKTAIPMVEKKVKEESFDAANQTGSTGYTLEQGYNDVADYDIGDDVNFMLIGTMPTTLADYSTYKYVFHDTLSSGLTYNKDVEVFLDDDNDPTIQYQINPDSYSVSASEFVDAESENTIKISFTDVKNIKDMNGNALTVTADSKIIAKYTAKLNNNAKIGLPGNPNTVYLQYSNNPNYVGDGSPDDDDNTGDTPEDKVIVFTYELDVTKIDGEDKSKKKLDGAEFALSKKVNGTDVYYKNVNGAVTWVSAESDATKLTSVNGEFKVVGLEDGTYYLKEIKAPVGYNMLKKVITVTVDATTVNNQMWIDFVPAKALTALSINVFDENNSATVDETSTNAEENAKSGVVKMNVANTKGSLLPETGGVGTVLIYTIGSILVVGSLVLLVTKKRMDK